VAYLFLVRPYATRAPNAASDWWGVRSLILVIALAKQTDSADIRSARAAAGEWLRRTPEFATKIRGSPGGTKIIDQDHAIVLVTSWPPGPLQGVIRLTRINGAWQVTSATTRPQSQLIVAIMFRFDYTAAGKAEHIELFRCINEGDQSDGSALVRPDEIAGAAKIIASRQYYPTAKAKHQKGYDSVLFDTGARQFLLD
jgi:hypothetical protein